MGLSRIVAKSKQKMDTVVQKVTFEVFRSVILRTPVDTGRARANWMPSVGSPNLMAHGAPVVDKAGNDAIARAGDVALKTPAGNITYLTNTLPYIRRLEYGYSKQAPAGMVRITAVSFQNTLNGAARTS
jgi:hypothetical protein